MAIARDASTDRSWAARMLTTDFCPWANRCVYWLKEPVGWFVLATAISVFIGLHLSPIGWTLAASLASIIAIGMAWPLIAVRAVTCSLSPNRPQVHEGDPCELRFSVRNRFPLPFWGFAVEGFLDRKREDEDQGGVPTVALAYVRACATSTYQFSIRPDLRGHYPDGDAMLTCSFPFGIWTAKRKLQDISPVTVWPKVFPITGQTAMTGRRAAESGNGNRSGRNGDFLGVREYRHGDCLRQVNWPATARSGDLVVTERSGPQCPSVDVSVDVKRTSDPEQLADRIRVAASVLANLHQSAVSVRIHLGDRCIQVRRGWEGFVQMMDALTDIPAEGLDVETAVHQTKQDASIAVFSNRHGDIEVNISDPSVNARLAEQNAHRVIRRDEDLAKQMLAFWTEVCDANLVA